MFDITLRHVKDRITAPLSYCVPKDVTPIHITGAAFLSGILACMAATDLTLAPWALSLWLLNRALDGLDGAVARNRQMVSELGGFLDLLGDFIVYSLLPIAVALGQESEGVIEVNWLAVAILEGAIHINNFVLFYISAVASKRDEKELTSITMRPALIEGLESGLLFTAMLIWPEYINAWCWVMSAGVAVGICQRVLWVVPVLQDIDRPKEN